MKADFSKIKFSIDRGGTFTDIYAELPDGKGYKIVKLLSEDPQNYKDAPQEGIRRILEEVSGSVISTDNIPIDSIEWVRMGTTVATNALLERKGERSALLITKGFKDLLQIGDQSRPEIFDLIIKKPSLLFDEVVEVEERVRPLQDNEEIDKTVIKASNGEYFKILIPIDRQLIEKQLTNLFKKNIRSIAVVLLHAYAFHEHEKLIKEIAQQIGFTQISISHNITPTVKIVPRGDTTTVDAYLTPHIKRYLEGFLSGFKSPLQNKQLLFMQSDGGLTKADHFKGYNAILSGPAGGVVGYAMTTYNEMGQKPVIGFDMGGTSTDVSRYGGTYELIHETQTAGVRIQAPQLQIETVAAGGGSRLFYRNGMFEVGPESSGAHPGPICYRKNGYLSITDANLYLGRLQPDFFPKIFGPKEDQPLDYNATKEAFEKIKIQINTYIKGKKGQELSTEEVALGFLKIANQTMIRPIREISVMRGYDIKEHVLACFGGAGGQHACAIASELGISKIYIHRFAGILSAYGMGLAEVVADIQEPYSGYWNKEDSEIVNDINNRIGTLHKKATSKLEQQGFQSSSIQAIHYLNLRYEGTDTAIMIAEPIDGDYQNTFEKVYQREFGFILSNRKLCIDDYRVRAVAHSSETKQQNLDFSDKPVQPRTQVSCYFETGWKETDLYKIEDLNIGTVITGPAMIIQETSTILIEPGSHGEITKRGDLIITINKPNQKESAADYDPIQLSIFSHLFMSIAEQMGRALQKTAISTNIKERLDFSCAIFDQLGDLVANAPHIPVHLGAMGETVKNQIILQGDNLKEGDVIVTNHPMYGGSHLPDITVITPVWIEGKPVFYLANRGHHADIGGINPGSMPPFSTRLDEEGICIKSFKLVEKGEFKEKEILELLLLSGKKTISSSGKNISGSRAVSDNLSDLKAQVAANKRGVDLLLELVNKNSLNTVHLYMSLIQQTAEEAVRKVLKKMPAKLFAEDHLDDGSKIQLNIEINSESGDAIFDFSGTSYQSWGNLNAPKAVTMSAILYSLRCLLEHDIPLNQGCLKPIHMIIEEGSLLSPDNNAAVVGGNVLTSQRVTDIILKAFGVAAASQGCMNNLTFGNSNFGYYETIGGGAGAGKTWNGQSGVHTHMTNTRITDPEILERRYPVQLQEFSIRKRSGGRGITSGGDGLNREFEFLAPLKVSILSERRVFPPFGLEGGENGSRGENLYIPSGKRPINLGSKNEVDVNKGDRIRISTPGGGGFGSQSISNDSIN